MAKPATLPGPWATDGGAQIVEPPAVQKGTGWTAGQKPPNSYFNWLTKWVYAWCAYLDGLTTEALSWTAAQTFAAAVSMTNTFSFTGTTLTLSPTGAVSYNPTQTASLGAMAMEDIPYIQQTNTVTVRRALGKFRIGAGAASTVRLYVGLYGGNPFFEIAFNAIWTTTSGKWFADSIGTQMAVWRIGQTGIICHRGFDPGGGTPGMTDAQLDDAGTELLVDSDNKLIAAAPKLHVIGAGFEPAYANTWTNIVGAETLETYFYRSLDGHIHIELATDQANGAGKSGTTIFTLPAGFRPSKTFTFHLFTWEKPAAIAHHQATVVARPPHGQVKAFFDDTNGGTVTLQGHAAFLPTQP